MLEDAYGEGLACTCGSPEHKCTVRDLALVKIQEFIQCNGLVGSGRDALLFQYSLEDMLMQLCQNSVGFGHCFRHSDDIISDIDILFLEAPEGFILTC